MIPTTFRLSVFSCNPKVHAVQCSMQSKCSGIQHGTQRVSPGHRFASAGGHPPKPKGRPRNSYTLYTQLCTGVITCRQLGGLCTINASFDLYLSISLYLSLTLTQPALSNVFRSPWSYCWTWIIRISRTLVWRLGERDKSFWMQVSQGCDLSYYLVPIVPLLMLVML